MIRGKHPTLLNVTYVRPTKENEGRECFEVIYKTEDGEVRRSEEAANADIYIVKPEFRDYNYNKPQERMERLEKVRCKISQIRRVITKEMGDLGKQIIDQANTERDWSRLNEVYRWPFAYACDFQPEYYFMKNWYEKYELGTPKLTTAWMDIETDLMDYTLDMDDIPNTAYSPVNLITVILDETNESWTFVLRPQVPSRIGRSEQEYKERYDLYLHQMEQHKKLLEDKNVLIDKLHEEFDGMYGGISYNVREYEREIDLIADAFRLINKRKPNFCLLWNMRFDIQYLYYRIQALGYNPADIMCHPDFPEKKCFFTVDKSTYQLEKQYDYFYCSSYTQFICQMRLYASIRKSQHTLRSVALNAIGDRELRDHKVEYPAEANIVRFPYVDWIRFMIYNVKDVLLQRGIERKCKDVLTYYMRSHSNLTPYNKIFKETHLLRNVREMYFEKEGWVQANNINILNTRSSEKNGPSFYGDEDNGGGEEKSSFKGAINAEPSMNDHVGLMVLGRRSNNVFANAMDYDMGAFYPSIKIASNMDPGTLLSKAMFDNNEFTSGEKKNRSLNQTYIEKDKNGKLRKLDITGEAVNTFVSGNILTFGHNYLGLPSITDIAMRVEQVLKKK